MVARNRAGGSSQLATATAGALLASFPIFAPKHIDLEAICGELGILPTPRALASGEGRLLRTGGVALARIDERAWGKPWGRFILAHEIGHCLLHPNDDSFLGCLPGAELDARAVERREREEEANYFAAELLMPRWMFSERCAKAPPTLNHVRKLARAFDVSLSAASLRLLDFTSEPCAMVVMKEERVAWHAVSGEMELDLRDGEELDGLGETCARRVLAGETGDARGETTAACWRAGKGRLSEHAVRLGESGGTLVWLRRV